MSYTTYLNNHRCRECGYTSPCACGYLDYEIMDEEEYLEAEDYLIDFD